MRNLLPTCGSSLSCWTNGTGKCAFMTGPKQAHKPKARRHPVDSCIGAMYNRVFPMQLPAHIREFFRRQGSIGGKKRNAQLSPEQRSAIGRKAAQARWAAVRERGPAVKAVRKQSKRGGV